MTRLNTQDGRELEKVNLESELGVAAAAAFAKAEPQQLAAQAWALPPAPQPAFLLMFVPGIPVPKGVAYWGAFILGSALGAIQSITTGDGEKKIR